MENFKDEDDRRERQKRQVWKGGTEEGGEEERRKEMKTVTYCRLLLEDKEFFAMVPHELQQT